MELLERSAGADYIRQRVYGQIVSKEYLPSPYKQPTELQQAIWKERYALPGEETIYDTLTRVAAAILDNPEERSEFYALFKAGVVIPAGRILAGAGSDRSVTLINCYVQNQVQDSMAGIMTAQREVGISMSHGAGVGTSFSTIRPKNAKVVRKATFSSGTIPFMQMWDSMSKTIRSAGERRGAMMATLADDHPDIEEFIQAKQTPGELTQFNISVLISDRFLNALEADQDWELGFWIPPHDDSYTRIRTKKIKHQVVAAELDKEVGDRADWYVYKTIPAKQLWQLIMESTYEYSEPGVIFIDRINQLNPLSNLEYIDCTNPCGEQPLPGDGSCNLGSINLLYCVKHPFTARAEFDYELLVRATRSMTIFLDCVLDKTQYPLESQRVEAKLKRRIGLGITGLAHCLLALGLRYGSESAVSFTADIMRQITDAAYEESVARAIASTPAVILGSDEHRKEYVRSEFIQTRLPTLKEKILKHGIRNCLLTSIAPTGTISLFAGNVSSGVEPVFAYTYSRKITRADEQQYLVHLVDPSIEWYNRFNKKQISADDLPSHFVSAQDLTVDEHLAMLAAAQSWTDSSVSKTINVPVDYSFEDFSQVYLKAYALGCKAVSTYRPSKVRGSVLEVGETQEVREVCPQEYQRPTSLSGQTLKVEWQGSAYYLTINRDADDKFRECFVNSKAPQSGEWLKLFCRQLSALARVGIDIRFLLIEAQEISSAGEGSFFNGRYYHSLAALLAHTIETYLYDKENKPLHTNNQNLQQCPSCKHFAIVVQSGCETCIECGYSKC